ncbi:MAG: hypothetical protein AAFQ09_04620 [Pseudomonadota bacterium]
MEVAKALRADGGKITCLHVMEVLPKYATEYLPADHAERQGGYLGKSGQFDRWGHRCDDNGR